MSLDSLDTAPRQTGGVSLREILTTAFRDWKRIAAVLLAGLVLTAIAAALVPSKYTSDAALLLRLGREYIYTPEVGDPTNGTPMAYDREQTLMAEAKILTSRDIKEAMLESVGVAAVYPDIAAQALDPLKQRDAAVLRIERALDAELLKGSNLMEVSFTHRDPNMAAKVLAALIDAYLARRSIIFASATFDTAEADFVARTIQLNAAESQLAALKNQRGIRAFAEEQSLLLAQRNALDMRQGDNALALAQAGGRASSLKTSLVGVGSDVTLSSETQRSEAVENARKLLLDLRLKERDLSSKFVEIHPAVLDVRADLARTQAYIAELDAKPNRTVRTGRSPARDSVETELLRSLAEQSQARAGQGALAAQRAAVDARLAVLAASEGDLRGLERDRRLAEVNYEAAAKRLRDEMVHEELDRKRKSNVSIVQAPRAPLQPQSSRTVVLLVGTFLSLCAALLMAFLSALWRDTFLTPEELQRNLDIPLLSTVARTAA